MKTKLIDRIFQELKHQDVSVRKNAAQALARFAPKGVTAKIQQALLNETDIKVGKWLALALAKIGDANTKQTVSTILRSAEDTVDRDWLLLAEAVLSKRNTQKEIKTLLGSNSTDALKQAAQLLWMKGVDPTAELRNLQRLASHEDHSVRRWAILALGKAKMKEVNGIIHGLSDDDYLVREWTECALAAQSKLVQPSLLMPGLNDEHPRVREWAVKALASTKKGEIPEILVNYLPSETDTSCREAVYRSLKVLPKELDLTSIISNATQQEENPSVLMAVIDLLTTTPSTKGNIEIITQLDNRCNEVDRDLLSPYLLDRLYDNTSDKEKAALEVLKQSETNHYIFDKMMKAKAEGQSTTNNKRITIGVVIALKEEFRVFTEIVGAHKPLGNGFYKFPFEYAGNAASLIVKLVGAKGSPRAMMATNELVENHAPNVVVNIGIAASLDSELLLGDVVVATQVTDYMHDSKTVTEGEGWKFLLSGDPYPIAYNMLNQALNFEFEFPELYNEWRSKGVEFTNGTMSLDAKNKLVDAKAMTRMPNTMEAKIASGPAVGASDHFTKWLKENSDRSFKAFEMESVGVTAAATLKQSPTPVFVLRGISDFGDERKNELENDTDGAVRKIAMANATNYLLALFGKMKF